VPLLPLIAAMCRALALSLAICVAICATTRADDPLTIERHWLEVVRVQIHDADTITGDVLLPLGVSRTATVIRASGYDAWEVGRQRQTLPFARFDEPQWQAEIERGVRARDELTRLAAGGRWYIEPIAAAAAYGRVEARLFVATKAGRVVELRQWAAAGGHVRR
jgi:hypothetical protein